MTLRGNVIVDNANVSASFSVSDAFPPGNFLAASFQKIGFVDYLKGDWRLLPSSSYRNRATDRSNPGVDFDQLNAAQASQALSGSAPK